MPLPHRRAPAFLALAAAAVALVLCALHGGCSRESPVGARADGPARIVVTIPPLTGLVKSLAPSAEITTLLPPGVSEHGFELTAGAISAVGRADLVVLIGAGLEPQVERLLGAHRAPAGRGVLRFSDAVGVQADPHADHDHAHDDGHDHGPVDPHLWLDPVLVEQFAPALAQALAVALERAGDSDGAATIGAREADLLARVRAVDEAYRTRLEPFRARAIVTQHGAFTRLADRYGLRIAAVLRASETTEPTPAQIAEVARLAREGEISAIFTEPQSASAEADRLAQRSGLPVLTLDPLGTGDWEAMMRANLDALVEGLSPR